MTEHRGQKAYPPKPSEETVKEAIRTILRDEKRYNTQLNYAVNYCKVALEMTGDDLRVQCLYVLGNIIHWRHQEAAKVRTVLKNFIR